MINGDFPNAPLPFRTFARQNVAFHLNRDPTCSLSLKEVIDLYHIPQLQSCLEHYLDQSFHSLERAVDPNATRLRLWTKVRLQGKTYHLPHNLLPPYTILAEPPSDAWPHGHFDTVIVNMDEEKQWPYSGLDGELNTQVTRNVQSSNTKVRTLCCRIEGDFSNHLKLNGERVSCIC